MAQVQLNPTIELTPYQKYQQALLKYQAQNPQLNAQYEAAGFSPPAPTPQTDPMSQVLKAAMAKKLLTSGGSEVASTAAQNAAYNEAAGLASQEAWNAGANAASQQVAAQQAAPTVLGNAAGMGALPLAGIGLATYLGGNAAYDMIKGKKASLPGRIVLGMATGGLSEVANKLFNRKTTKDYQREKWGELANSASIPTQNYAKSYLDYLKSDQAGIDAQYPNTFEGKKEAGTLRAEDVWGGHGMFKTFGDDWLGKYTEDQRRAVSNALLANDLIRTSKGDQYITDEAKAKELAANSIQALLAKPVNNPNSPGFKDGKRINLGTR